MSKANARGRKRKQSAVVPEPTDEPQAVESGPAEASDAAPIKKAKGKPLAPSVVARNAARKQQQRESWAAKRKRVLRQIKRIKRLRPRTLTFEQRLDILLCYYTIQLDTLDLAIKKGEMVKGKAQARTCKLLGCSTKTVVAVTSEWNEDETVSGAAGTGNKRRKKTRVPRTKDVLVSVRNFVRARRRTQTRVTALDVRSHLRGEKHLVYDEENKTDCRNALRAVQRYLRHEGFQRGVRKGVMSYQEKESLAKKRWDYLSALAANRAKPSGERKREVYLDESYIHHHYKRHQDSLFDPSDAQDSTKRVQHKGKRYCFIAAIRESNPDERVAKQESDKAGLVPGSVVIFSGGKQKKDYHQMFDGTFF